ncbi:hypothetical protein N7494_009931 [Penicillium frequentans]|uniref:Uncharacterized protein n=1 Tax=Penicillium frequentans TaxID=3151616 RepID=A0AAD6CQY4_9EURO|nr:hypothetical protein N7494_009931 [Penicillium glabrum]
MLADTCMKSSSIKSSLRYNASVDTRPPTPVITDITRDVTSPEDTSHPTLWPVFEPYLTPTRIDPTPPDIISQLLHAELDYVKSVTGVRAPVEGSSAMALPVVTVISMTQETSSGPGGGVTDFSSHTTAMNGSASWSLDTIHKSISFAVETVHTNQKAAEALPAQTSRATSRLSPADSEHTSTEASTRYDDPTEAKNGVSFSNSTIRHSPSHTKLSHGAYGGKTFLTTDHGDQVSTSILSSTNMDTGTWTPSSSNTARTSVLGPHGAIMDGTEFSRRLSQRGVALVLGSVAGGTLVFICMVLLHRLILRLLHRSEQGSTRRGPLSIDEPFVRQIAPVSSNVADISHFSADS